MNNDQLFIKMTITAWETENSRVSKLLDALSDEQLFLETSPGRNRGIYLIGHLIAVSDSMCTLFGWGERLYPQLEPVFIKSPDKSGLEMPAPSMLREYWHKVYAKISQQISQTSVEEWLAKHTAVSAEDFAKEPFRNKLNVLISRTNHMSYHRGQLVYLSKK